MSEKMNFTPKQVIDEVLEQTDYAVKTLRASREALFESNVGEDFKGKVPRPVVMHAISRALTEVKLPGLDYDKFHRGILSLVLFFLEDDDVNLALKIKKELKDTDDE